MYKYNFSFLFSLTTALAFELNQSMVFISLPPSPTKPTFESFFSNHSIISISKISIFETQMPHFSFSHHTLSPSPLIISLFSCPIGPLKIKNLANFDFITYISYHNSNHLTIFFCFLNTNTCSIAVFGWY